MRRRASLSQDEVAESSGLHVATIRRIEAPKEVGHRPEGHHPSTIRNLAKALGCKPVDITEDIPAEAVVS